MGRNIFFLFIFPIFLFANSDWINQSLYKNFSEANFLGLKEKIEKIESEHPRLLKEIQCLKVHIKNNHPIFTLASKKDDGWWVIESLKNAVKEVCLNYPLKDCVFFISYTDLVNPGHLSEVEGFPVLTSTKHKSMKNSIPIPDQEALRGYYDIAKDKNPDEVVTNLANRVEFKKKIKVALFRGLNSGCNRELTINGRSDEWYKSSRGQLIYESCLADSKLVNAKFTNFFSDNIGLQNKMRQSIFRSTRMSIKDQLCFRYLMDIDGWGCSYSRLYWILGSKSVCLKVQSDLEQWYYPGLVDKIHLFYIQPTIASAHACVEYLNDHEAIAEGVANEAHHFFKTYLNQCFQRQYFAKVLWLYSELYNQNFSVLETLK